MGQVQALKSFWVGRKMVHKGDVLAKTDPLVVGREHLFRVLPGFDAPVETATAAPGEKRATKRPAPVAAKAPAVQPVDSVEE